MPEMPDYDAAATEDDEMAEEESADLDQTFLDYAAEAGMDETQAAALKKAIDRCMELKETGSYDMDEMGMGDMGEEMPEV